MHGEGIFRWNDGKVYEGHFDKGELHGTGKITYPNGQAAKGTWHHGENLQLDNIQYGR
jgi:hypothetical protein